MQTLQDASYLGTAAACIHNTLGGAFAYRLPYIPRVPVRWPELHSHAARLATTLQGLFSLSLKAVSHTCLLVSSDFLLLPETFFFLLFFPYH